MTDLFRLDGRAALVTGGSRGLGLSMARTLARAGAKVVLAARDEAKLAEAAELVRAEGGEVATVAMDVTVRDSVTAGVAAAEAALGPIRVLVNNSGIAVTKRLLDVDEDDWRRVIDTNLTGAWFVAQETACRMAAHGQGGSIVNISSLIGIRPMRHVIGYNASKAGLLQLTRVMAMELARNGIRVNALAPGYFETEMNLEFIETPGFQAMIERIPQRRLGREGDLDGPLLFFASDASRYVTGDIMLVDGGHNVAAI